MLDTVVLISGGGSNLKALLTAAEQPDSPFRIVAVAADNFCDGLRHAADHGVPSFVVSPKDHSCSRAAWGEALAAGIREYGVDTANGLVVSAGFMRILPPNFIAEFSPRLINTHPALLPNFPGAHAVRDALAAGATETGVTVHVIDEGVDTGPIIAQHAVSVLEGDSEEELHERIKTVERQLLVNVVKDIATGKQPLPPTP